MSALPTEQNNYPVLPSEPVVTDTAGHEALAQAGEKISREASHYLLLNQVSDYQKAAAAAKQSILENPSHANIDAQRAKLKGARAGLEAIPLNLKDRGALSFLLSNHDTTFQSFVSGIQLRQARLLEHEQIVTTLSDDVNAAVMAGLQGDSKTSQRLTAELQERLEHGLTSGALSPAAYDRAIEVLHAKHDQAQQLLQTVSGGQFSPEAYHATQAFGLEHSVAPTVKTSIVQHPTQWFIDYHDQDTTYRDFIADAQHGKINVAAYMKMTATQAQEARLSMQGIAQAKGDIESGLSYPVVQQKMIELDKNPTPTLSQQAQLNHYKLFFEKLNTNFQDAIAETAAGQRIRQQYNAHVANIEDNSVLSPQAKAEQLQQAGQTYLKSLVNVATALGVPANVIKPVPQEIMQAAESGFKLDADPQTTLNYIKNYSATGNGVWFANSGSTDMRQEILNLGRLTANTADFKFLGVIIAANQTGRDFSTMEFKNKTILNKLDAAGIFSSGAIRDGLTFITLQPSGAQRGQMVKRAIKNTILYMAQVHNDYNLTHLNDYISKIKAFMQAAYPTIKGYSRGAYMFNTKTLPISAAQANVVAHYLYAAAIPKWIKQHGISDTKTQENFDMQPFYLINTPDGRLVLVNQNTGHQSYQVTFSHHLLQTALDWNQKMMREIEEKARESSVVYNSRYLMP